MGPFNDLVEKGLVADVHTVKISDGDDACWKGLANGVKALNVLHLKRFPRPTMCLTCITKANK
jgi:hypothetical protein